MRKILDSKKVSINRSTNRIEPQKASNNGNSAPVPVNNNNGSQCPYCRRVYADATAVNRHIKKYCLKEKRFSCLFCNYKSKRRDHIVRHSIRVHEAQLRQKITDGEFAVPSDAVMKDGKLCEPEGAIDTDLSLDFSALYPEIQNDELRDDEFEMPVKTEPLDSDDEG